MSSIKPSLGLELDKQVASTLLLGMYPYLAEVVTRGPIPQKDFGIPNSSQKDTQSTPWKC